LSASIGTPYEIDTRGKILFIEDVNEDIYRIDRFAWQLHDSGKFRDCAGVLLGPFVDCENKHQSDFTALECFKDILGEAGVPVLWNVRSGHAFPMMTLPFGAECSIDTASKTIRIYPER
jgi:muramoyltetrapeptide carboxypeptidase